MVNVLVGSHALMSCFEPSLHEKNVSVAGAKSTGYFNPCLVPLADHRLTNLSEEKTQQAGLLEPTYDQDLARNRGAGYDSLDNIEFKMSNEELTMQHDSKPNGELKVEPRRIETSDYKDNKKHTQQIKLPKESSVKSCANVLGLMISEENIGSESQLLEYINNAKDNNINLLLRKPGYISSKIDSNDCTKNSPGFFLEEKGQLKLMEELKKYCEWKESKETGAISNVLKNTLEHEAIYQHIKEKIDKCLVPKSTDQSWKEEIRYFIDSYKDYGTANYNINEPEKILVQACRAYIESNNALLKRLESLGSLGLLYSLYCEKEKKDKKASSTHKEFLGQTKNREAMHGIRSFYVQEKLKRGSPWEEINAMLQKYKLPYKVDYRVDTAKDAGEFSLMKITQGGSTNLLDLKALSSEEELILDLMSWLFYFPERSSNGEERLQIKNIVIRPFDKSSKQLDLELRKKLYEVIDNEFVQKRQTGVIMTTYPLDKAIENEILRDNYSSVVGGSKL